MRLKSGVRAIVIAGSVFGLALAATGGASAQQPSTTYTARLAPVPLNGANSATGSYSIVLNGNQATITGQVSGLASTFMNAPYPHVQHIHGGAMGTCPAAGADKNGDGVLSTADGEPSYGGIQTTLSLTGDSTPAAGTNVQTAPSGASFNYSRTLTLDAATIASLTSGKAVIVVHGLDPASAAAAAATAPSELVPSLPLAATSPALCGVLTAGASSTPPATMRPPTTGDAGLASESSTTWTLYAAASVLAAGLVGVGALGAVRNRNK